MNIRTLSNKTKVAGKILCIILIATGLTVGQTASAVFNGSTAPQREQSPASAPMNQTVQTVPGEIVVKLRNGATPENSLADIETRSVEKVISKPAMAESSARPVSRRVTKTQSMYLVRVSEEKSASVTAQLKANPAVEYAEPNYIIKSAATLPADPRFNEQWALHNLGQNGGMNDADIDAPEAWDITTAANMTVGILDSGVDYTHEDLAASIWTNPGEIPDNAIDDDNNGYVDDVHGWDFINNDSDPMDDYGHGTHVAGIIGASANNGRGVAGVSWQVKLVPLKVLDASGAGSTAAAIRAIEYANAMGIQITNASWTGQGFSQALYDAIADTADGLDDTLLIAAAGNYGANSDQYPLYPAAYDLPNIISVAATDASDRLAYFSNYGSTSVDIAAPGVEILSTVPAGNCSLGNSSGYATMSGTSMAAPHVTGIAALVWGGNASQTAQQIKSKILYSGNSLPALQSRTATGGRVNAYNALDNDTVAPSAITNLTASVMSAVSVRLDWTAPGDDGTSGTAAAYDIRYSESPITDSGFSTASAVTSSSQPSTAGTAQSQTVSGLDFGKTYYFAIKTVDNRNNISPVSNAASAVLPALSVIVQYGFEGATTAWSTSTVGGLTDANLWHVSTRRSFSPSKAWYFGVESSGTYNTGRRAAGELISPSINLANSDNSVLSFQHYLQTENNPAFDRGEVKISQDNGATWQTILTAISTNQAWQKQSLDLSAYDGKTIRVKFVFDSRDGNMNAYEGWYVDSVAIYGTVSTRTPTAVITAPAQAMEDTAVQFSGSGSSSPDGQPLTYKWSFGDNTTKTVTTAGISHTYAQPGTYTVQLVVNNGQTNSVAATKTIIITDKVVIKTATYSKSKKQLVIQATSSANAAADLQAQGYGDMSYNATTKTYRLVKNNVATAPANVKVTSAKGGSDTNPVTKIQ